MHWYLHRQQTFLGRILNRIARAKCQHEFRYRDMHKTGILQPPDPKPGASREELEKWGSEVVCGNHPWHTERISWTCCKCGKEFRRHCGLDVLKHGRCIGDQPRNE